MFVAPGAAGQIRYFLRPAVPRPANFTRYAGPGRTPPRLREGAAQVEPVAIVLNLMVLDREPGRKKHLLPISLLNSGRILLRFRPENHVWNRRIFWIAAGRAGVAERSEAP